MKTTLLGCVGFLSIGSAFAQSVIDFQTYIPGTLLLRVYGPLSNNPTFHQTGNGPGDIPAGTQDWSSFTPIGASGSSGPFGASTTFAQLLGADGAGQPESSLQLGFPVTTFKSGLGAGYIQPTVVTFNNIPLDTLAATIEMVAWDNSSGLYSTWTEAQVAWREGLIAAGESGSWYQALPIQPPAVMINYHDPSQHVVSFNLYYIPEPSALWLAGFGIMMLLFRRLRPPARR
jgi:hypothetical protein